VKVALVTLMATFAIQLGYFLWKVAADSLPRIGEARSAVVLRGFVTSWRWMLGLCSTIVGWLLFIKATDLGEVSVVQPLMSVGDLILVLLAVVFLHERLSRSEWIGLALTVVGAVLLSFEAKEIQPAAINWPRLAVFVALSAVAWGVCVALGRRARRPEIPLAIAVGIGFGTGAILTELMTAYLSLSGQDLASAAFLLNPILPFMVAANVAGLGLLQMAFQRGRAAVIVPVQLAVANGVVVSAGALVFAEAISVLRLGSILLIVAGAAVLHGSARKEAAAHA
jgi:uncharacterized membrane protein